jgi:hypothetical protein
MRFCIVFVLLTGNIGMANMEFSQFLSQIDSYLQSYHHPNTPFDRENLQGDFSYKPSRRPDMYGSADMVYLLFAIGELEKRTTTEGRKAWAEKLKNYQDPITGWFNIRNETLHGNAHATAYLTGALKLLGAQPKHDFHWAQNRFSSFKRVKTWLDNFAWIRIWPGSHKMGEIAALSVTEKIKPDEIQWVFQALDQRAHPENGFWMHRLFSVPGQQALGGASHFWWIYQYHKKDIPKPKAAIDHILRLQEKNGFWDSQLFGADSPYCIDLDSINGLRFAFHQIKKQSQASYKEKEILESVRLFVTKAHEVLNQKDSLKKLYKNSHKLPGAVIAIAEANLFYQELTGESLIDTPIQWQSPLPVAAWL